MHLQCTLTARGTLPAVEEGNVSLSVSCASTLGSGITFCQSIAVLQNRSSLGVVVYGLAIVYLLLP